MSDQQTPIRYLRLRQILGDAKLNIPAIIPVSKSTWWAGVKSGRFPTPHKLGARTTVWAESDIVSLSNSICTGAKEACYE